RAPKKWPYDSKNDLSQSRQGRQEREPPPDAATLALELPGWPDALRVAKPNNFPNILLRKYFDNGDEYFIIYIDGTLTIHTDGTTAPEAGPPPRQDPRP